MNLKILNQSQVTKTTPELASLSPNSPTKPAWGLRASKTLLRHGVAARTWSRTPSWRCRVTSSSPVSHEDQPFRWADHVKSVETQSTLVSMVLKFGRCCRLRRHPRHSTVVQNYKIRCQ
ncbi:hypothetical protein TNCV_3552221 [Trichonephila clavipes]|nr:hypothetical protein TNCV_3552221 [Trichonephila clavipes]